MKRNRAFTLIELLVVIAVIALLIGILLPALRDARETSQATVCVANMSQIGKAANLYANDYKDQLWPQFEWAPIQFQLSNMTAPRLGYAVMYQYVEDVYKINECPKNKRRSITGTVNTSIDPQFGTQLGVGFDYCMLGRFEGVKLGAPIRVAHLTSPQTYAAAQKPPAQQTVQSSLTILSGIPIYVEESTFINNQGVTDGLWGNYDQVTRRHFKKGNVVFFEGHAGPWKVPTSNTETATNNARDLDCNDLYVSGRQSKWYRVEPTDTDNRYNWGERPYGWANAPR